MAVDTYYTVTGNGDEGGVSPNGTYEYAGRHNAHDYYLRTDSAYRVHYATRWYVEKVSGPTGAWESSTDGLARPEEGEYDHVGACTGTVTVARVGPELTDHFERAVDPTSEPAPWDVAAKWAGGSATIDTTAAYEGTYGLHLDTVSSGDNVRLGYDSGGASELYLGCYLRVVSCQNGGWVLKDDSTWGMFQVRTKTGGGAGKFRLDLGAKNDSDGWDNTGETDDYDLDTWIGFVEVYLKVTDAGQSNGGMKLWIDGVELLSRLDVDNDTMDFDLFGPHIRHQGTTKQEAYYDRVQIATSRIYPPRGFKVYHNAGVGPIDYDTVRDACASNVTDWTSDVLAYPNTWRFGVRAYNEYGEEKNVNVARDLVLLASGEESPARPNRPVGVAASAAEGGKVEVTFSYDATHEAAACTRFHVCYDAGSGEINYASPLGVIDKDDAPLTHYAFLSDALTDGQAYRFAVRAATADDVEDDGIEFVEVTADAQAPTQPESLSGLVVR